MGIAVSIDRDILRVTLSGDFVAYTDDIAKEHLIKKAETPALRKIIIDGKNLGKWDSTLIVVLFELGKRIENKGIRVMYYDMPEGVKALVALAFSVNRKPDKETAVKETWLEQLGTFGLNIYDSTKKGLSFLKDVWISLVHFFSCKAIMRKVDFLFALEDCGYKAVGIVTLISFMVGLILAFVGAVQLQLFGAEVYVAALVAIGMTRIMGAVMAGIIMAGRTGASYAATIGTMQVNEEVDALKTLGVSITDFLVLPRILALAITLPLLTVLADFMGMLGGAFVSIAMLGVSSDEYWRISVDTLNATNFLVGVFHGWVFGLIVAICGCYFGVNSGKDADSVGKATTNAVVYSIVWIVIATGIITWCCVGLGL